MCPCRPVSVVQTAGGLEIEDSLLLSCHYHFIGIGGAGMSALAEVLLSRGCPVSGSDLRDSETVRALRAHGAQVTVGHQQRLSDDVAVVVVSDAIGSTNPELQWARARNLRVLSRADALDQVLSDRKSIAVTGTHGKTTTTGMVSQVLEGCGFDPLTLVGGGIGPKGTTARLGQGEWAVAEACEAFNAFLHLHPRVAVVTNIDADHLDYHGTFDNLLNSFREFIRSLPSDGCLIACQDDPYVRQLTAQSPAPVIGYGLGQGDLRAVGLEHTEAGSSYELIRRGSSFGRVRLSVLGEHNVLNSLAALAVAEHLGINPADAVAALHDFTGVKRRFDPLGCHRGVLVVDDYAHHPREVAATLKAAREGVSSRRLLLVFQPHLYSRTRHFLREFAETLQEPDVLYLTDIFAAREKPDGITTGRTLLLAAEETRQGKPTFYVPKLADLPELLEREAKEGDLVIVMGAGDIREVGEELVSRLSASSGA
jgi:UDP-N-acetylmuramate--alanine ligase